MAYYRDLEIYKQFGPNREYNLLAIGWLERGHEYSQGGDIARKFWDKLQDLIANPWNPLPVSMGVHNCSLCRFTPGVPGKSLILVPGNGRLYCAPDNIFHYIDAHEYCPPQEFQEAVIACPDRNSIDFLKAINAVGGQYLLA